MLKFVIIFESEVIYVRKDRRCNFYIFIFCDSHRHRISSQSASGISNASGTRSVRVNAQGFSRSCCKLSPVKSPSPQLAAPGSPRM